jgi:hypothetical protein
MGLFGKSKKELSEEKEKQKELEEQCKILNESEDITNKFPIGKPFKYLGETVWVTKTVPNSIRNYNFMTEDYWMGTYEKGIYKSYVVFEYWDKDRCIRFHNIRYNIATVLLKEI